MKTLNKKEKDVLVKLKRFLEENGVSIEADQDYNHAVDDTDAGLFIKIQSDDLSINISTGECLDTALLEKELE